MISLNIERLRETIMRDLYAIVRWSVLDTDFD